MTRFLFSETEREILYLILMDADLSIAALAKLTNCREHRVRYLLRRFKDQQIISRRVMIDVLRLGYSRHTMFLSLASVGQTRREDIIAYLCRSPHTSVVLEVGGDYDLFLALIVRSSTDLSEFYNDLSHTFGAMFQRKDVGISMLHSVFGEKVLTHKRELYRSRSYAVTHEVIKIDLDDHRILHMLGQSSPESIPVLARSLGMPASTVAYRLSKLKALGIISGDMYEIRGEMIGLRNFLIIVSMKGLSDELHQRFSNYVRVSPLVTHFTHDVGAWDYVLGAAVESSSQLTQLVEDLHREFGEFVSHIKPMPMFKAQKVVDYPFNINAGSAA